MAETKRRSGARRVPPEATRRGSRGGEPSRSRRGRRPPRARERTAARVTRGRAARRRAVALLSVVTVVAIGYLLFFTSMLGVASVDVLGAQSVPKEQILAAAAIKDREPLLRLDTDEIRHRVVAMPGIATADVSRSFPSSVEITVTERTAIGYVNGPGGAHMIDPTGVDFKTVDGKPAGLPELSLASIGPADPATRAVTAVLAGVPEQLRARITAARARTPGSVEFTLADGKVVRWGDANQLDRKAKVLAALLSREGRAYDVASPELPTIS